MTPVMMGQVIKKVKITRTLIVSRRTSWYQFHAETKGGSYWVTKKHEDILKVIPKDPRIIYSSSSTCLKVWHRLNSIWCRWI